MTDRYHDLIFNHSLYPYDFINDFGVSNPHWALESNRKRELSLRHDLVCIYLCNLEEIPYEDMLETLTQERKRKHSEETGRQSPIKRLRTKSPDPAIPSTSAFPSTSVVSGASSSGSSDVIMDRITLEAPYRFILIEGMPSPELIQNDYATKWGIDKPTSYWDIIDTHLKKFIEVKVSNDPGGSIQRYKEKRVGMGSNTALCVVNPIDGCCHWMDHPGGLNGEKKVMSFIIGRYEVMRVMGIIDTEIQEQKDLCNYIFTDSIFNEMRDKWIKDWWPLETLPEISKYITDGDKRPRGIEVKELLKNLSHLNELERVDTVQWKGKILPEGWVVNLEEDFENDNDLITSFMSHLSEHNLVHFPQEHEKDEDKGLLEAVLQSWANSDKKVFSFNVSYNKSYEETIKNWLGVGFKGKYHDPTNEGTKQPAYKEISPCKYDFYFDEIIRRLNQYHGHESNPFTPFVDDFPDTDHPIAKIGIQASKMLIEYIGNTNAAIFSSKLTNIYSRLGGAYLKTKQNGKTTHSDLAIMPIYATTYGKDRQYKKRLVSGILVRGPQHARSPTDRINILTIEIMPNNDQTKYFLGKQKSHSIWYDSSIIVVARRNAIMKEDSAFITFNANSLFVPANLLGVMTMENPNVPPEINMLKYSKAFLEENQSWFVERFTEGILMSAVANSRDEGYFAQLRKMFMFVFSLRRNKGGANWDIAAYCNKVNECLIDNPISMHFHNTLLKILKVYDSEK